ncbi:sterol desaturase family protein [Chryseolinea lacunae]|uniref:Sterol desaturase family protein n=1 Tax=Chryseolinea lacunae TaxID=2801331 RepID=A0ABS1KYC6_9BACT|nr:sterol desaturase family protein [Chryseolinea lacunae]MBL0744208.1 sterol desaturase family protein [Chryseolinea lacunae]
MNLNPIVLSIPIFFILIGIELVVERFTHKDLYRLPDAIANLSCGITSQLSGLFLKIFAIGIYQVLFEHFAFFTLTPNWLYWLVLFLLVDLAYYWAHRMSHEINLFWGGHVVHHQSEEYNLSVALRQSSLQVVWTFAFSLPIALLGFDTVHFALISALNTLYQFWIHTETIGKMGWFEYVFNTPSHHRVHHGRNPKYIDKNHAGSLIIWDRMFGTFQAEEEKPIYGITKPINSWNPVFANVSHYVEMAHDLKRIPTAWDKVRYLFKKPGWLPESLGGQRAVPEVDRATYRKYDTPAPALLNYYVVFQYVLCLAGTALFLFNAGKFSLGQQAFIAALVSLVVVNAGVLFENRAWAKYAEWFRIVAYPALLASLCFLNGWSPWLYVVGGAYCFISVTWFYGIQKKYAQVSLV